MNRYFNVPAGLTIFFAMLIGGVTVYAFTTTQIELRSCLEILAGLYYAALQLLDKVLPKVPQ